MNQMTSALAQAGVSLPTAQARIWNFVKGHPSVTARRVFLELKIPLTSVSSLMNKMVNRGMLRSEEKALRVSRGGGYVSRNVLHYSAVGDHYDPDRFPYVDKKPASSLKPTYSNPSLGKVEVSARITPMPSAIRRPAQETVNGLTVAQAREFWLILDRMFGDRK